MVTYIELVRVTAGRTGGSKYIELVRLAVIPWWVSQAASSLTVAQLETTDDLTTKVN